MKLIQNKISCNLVSMRYNWIVCFEREFLTSERWVRGRDLGGAVLRRRLPEERNPGGKARCLTARVVLDLSINQEHGCYTLFPALNPILFQAFFRFPLVTTMSVVIAMARVCRSRSNNGTWIQVGISFLHYISKAVRNHVFYNRLAWKGLKISTGFLWQTQTGS